MSETPFKKVSRTATLARLETVSQAISSDVSPLDAAFAAIEAATDDPVAMAAAQAALRQLLAFETPDLRAAAGCDPPTLVKQRGS